MHLCGPTNLSTHAFERPPKPNPRPQQRRSYIRSGKGAKGAPLGRSIPGDRRKPQVFSDGVENGSAGPEKKAENNEDKDDTRIRASRMEYKTVNEVWDYKAYEYKIVNSPPPQDVSELDEYVFVICKHVQKQMHDVIIYVDVKSPSLRDILRRILKDVRTVELEADKPTVERNLLFHFLSESKGFAIGSDHEDTMEEDGIRRLIYDN
ncbi:hypothetical protein CNMCM6106_008810 [Aspergillus hiratsukae]|uniref:Uncharacterized protein n=1 Tax=Aspergillus hiratsukae TaxID=1194566 RepID=A0A8H6QIE3_9EURO|nr:hypothetical protein CNMCM6106_008810 [Aspergillus hiratsukae]